METSFIIARFLGGYLIISGLFLLIKRKTVPHLLKDFFGNSAVVYFAGLVLVFLSSVLLRGNNIWDGSWRTVITVFLWLIFFKGLAYIFFPGALHRLVNKKFLGRINFYGIIVLVVGISLFFLG